MNDTFQLSMETVIAASPMLGHKLEDRSRVRLCQDPGLMQAFQKSSALPLSNASQKELFLVAPFDILVECIDDEKRFHIIETNGTGIGGLTNLPTSVVSTVLQSLTEMARSLPGPAPLVLLAVSGQESSKHPRRNHLLHEKLLYMEALKRGLETRGEEVRLLTMAQLSEEPTALQTDQPTVVLGYIKEFLDQLQCGADGRLSLYDRSVTAGVNDRFCLNVISRFGHLVDLTRFTTINRCFASGADKGLAYGLLHEYAQAHPQPGFPDHIQFVWAESRAALIRSVMDWVRLGRKVVIKPQGTGLGHGLEFFLDHEEPVDAVIGKIDHSIRVTEHYYGAIGGAFPYTVCDFFDTCVIDEPGHALHGHKYELRVVVYRDGMDLKAIPSIAKVSSQGYDADKVTRLSLINNITTSAEAKNREGTDFMLPLANRDTLELLKIEPSQMEALCRYCAGSMRHILDQLQKQPKRFGLEQQETHVSNGKRSERLLAL